MDKGAQTFLDRSFVFDWHAEGHKWLTSLILVRTALANHLRGKCASKVGLDCLLLSASLDGALKSVQEHLQEFVDVHLLQHVGGLAVPVFESMTEAFGVDILLLRFQQAGKYSLKLVEHILVRLKTVMVWIVNSEKVGAEAWHHEELLHKRDHVADAAKVLQAHIACRGFLVVEMSNLPIA